MRKIELHEDIERRQRRWRIVGGVILVVILIISSAGYALINRNYTSADGNTKKQGELTYNGQAWIAKRGGQQLTFTYPPKSVENISTEITLSAAAYQGRTIYIDVEDPYIKNELALNLNGIAGRIQEACYGHCARDLPEKNCSDYLIVVRASEDGRVSQRDSCVFINGDVAATDAFLYRLLGFAS